MVDTTEDIRGRRGQQFADDMAIIAALTGQNDAFSAAHPNVSDISSARRVVPNIPVTAEPQAAPTPQAQALQYGAATLPAAVPAANSANLYSQFNQTAPGADPAVPATPEEATSEAAQFWSQHLGTDAAQYFNPDDKLDADDLGEETLVVQQAQEFLKYWKGFYNNGEEDMSDASASMRRLLTTDVNELSAEERQDVINRAIHAAGWIGNNTGGMGKAFAQLRGDNVPPAQKQAALFMMDISENLSFSANWGKKAGRFIYQGVLTDPTMIGSILVGVLTMGAGTAAAQLGIQGARFAGMTALRTSIRQMARTTVRSQLGRTMIGGAVVGAADAAANSAMEQSVRTQEINMDNGQTLQRQRAFSTGQVAISGVFGAGAGAGFVVGGNVLGTLISKTRFGRWLSNKFGRAANNADNASADADANVTPDADVTPTARAAEEPQPQTSAETSEPSAAERVDESPSVATANPDEAAPSPSARRPETASTAETSQYERPRFDYDEEQIPGHTEANGTKADNASRDVSRNILKAEAQRNEIETLLQDPRNAENVEALATGQIDFDEFLTRGELPVTTLSNDIKTYLTNDGYFMMLAQQAALRNKVNAAIEQGNYQFDIDNAVEGYGILKQNPEFAQRSRESYTFFIESNNRVLSDLNARYDSLQRKNSDDLTPQERRFIRRYDETYADNGGPIIQDGKITFRSSLDERNYRRLEDSYLNLRRSEDSVIPKFDQSTSMRTLGFLGLLQNPGNINASDALRFSPRLLPIDSHNNIRNVIGSVDQIFFQQDFQVKVIDLQNEIQQIASRTIGDDAKRTAIVQRMNNFREQNQGMLQDISQQLALVEHAVNRWETNDYGSWVRKFGFLRQGISQRHKEETLSFVRDMRNMIGEMQKPGQEGEIPFGKESAHLAKATGENLQYAINRVYSNAVQSFMSHTRRDPRTGDPRNLDSLSKAEIHIREARARSIDGLAYNPHRTTSGMGIPKESGNNESVLDKTIEPFAQDVINNKGKWGVEGQEKVAGAIADLIKDGMHAEAANAVRELKWRLENFWPGDYYDGSWAKAKLKNALGGGDALKADPYLQHAYDSISRVAAQNARSGGGKPGYFAQDWLGGGLGGYRWAEEQYIRLTWKHRLAYRMGGTNDGYWEIGGLRIPSPLHVSKPVQAGLVESLIARPTSNTLKYMLGGVRITRTNKETGEKTTEWAWKNIDRLRTDENVKIHGVPERISKLRNIWNAQLATPLRAATRIAFLPEAAVWQGSKFLYRQAGNTITVVGGTALTLGAAELGIAAATGNEPWVNILAGTLDAGLWTADKAVDAVLLGNDAKMWALEQMGLQDDAFVANALRLWDRPEALWDWTEGGLHNFIAGRIGNYGEYAYENNLGHIFVDYNLQEIHSAFTENFNTQDISTLLASPDLPARYRQSLQQIQDALPQIDALVVQISSDVDTTADALSDAEEAVLNAQQAMLVEGGNPEAQERALAEAQRARDAARTNHNNALGRKDYLAKYMNAVMESEEYIQGASQQLAAVEEAIDARPNTITLRALERERDELIDKIDRHMRNRTNNLTPLLGDDPSAARTQNRQTSPDQSTADPSAARNQDQDRPEGEGEDDETSPARRQPVQINGQRVHNSPFNRGQIRRDDSDGAPTGPRRQRTTQDDDNDDTQTGWGFVESAIGRDASNTLRGAFGAAGDGIGAAWGAFKRSDSPWVGGAVAVLGAFLGISMFSKQGRTNMSNMFTGTLKILGFGALALVGFAGWRAWRNGGMRPDGPPPSERDGDQSTAARSTYRRPTAAMVPPLGSNFVRQSAANDDNVSPTRDPRYAGVTAASQQVDQNSPRLIQRGGQPSCMGSQCGGSDLADPNIVNNASGIAGTGTATRTDRVPHQNSTEHLGSAGTTTTTPSGTKMETIAPDRAA